MEVPQLIVEWITSFLCYREECVRIGHHISTWFTVKAGVTQGTKLGPLLFLIYINDLRPNCKTVKYTDETTLLTWNKLSKASEDPMQSCLYDVDKWCDENYMLLNPTKSKDMVFHYGERAPQLKPLRIKGEPIESVEKANLLGLTICANLKWESYVNTITAKASRNLYLLIQLM